MTTTAILFSFPKKPTFLSLGYIQYCQVPVFASIRFVPFSVIQKHAHQLSLLLSNKRMIELLHTLGNAGSQAPLPSSQSEGQHSAPCKRRTLGRLTTTVTKHKGVTGCWPKADRTAALYSKHMAQCNATCHRLNTSKPRFALSSQKASRILSFRTCGIT